MKIRMVSCSDVEGAGTAAYRLYRATKSLGMDSTLQVNRHFRCDQSILCPQTPAEKLKVLLRDKGENLLVKVLKKFFGSREEVCSFNSLSVIPSGLQKKLNTSDADIIHLHWVGNGMISIREIGKISKPLVWTLHDMWPFCGSEHYVEDTRYQDGYRQSKKFWDTSRWVWKRKMRHWKKPVQIVTPSHWLADCVRQSRLMGDWLVRVIPNCLDMEVWQMWEKPLARNIFNVSDEDGSLYLLFGALGGTSDPRKGFHFLQSALKTLHERKQFPNLKLIVFGSSEPEKPLDVGFPIRYMGHLHDEISLNLLYSAADAMVVPSTMESFGQMAVESSASGTPVVAFDNTGVADVVQHQKTGYLVKAFDVEDLARGIGWILEDKNRHAGLCRAARDHAAQTFSYPVVARQYEEVYRQVINS